MKLRDLKRVRLDIDMQMLCLPRYINKRVNVRVEGSKGKEKQWKRKLHDFVIVMFQGEDRVISDIIYGFKTAREFKSNVV